MYIASRKVPPARPEYKYDLTVNEDEALVLMALLGSVGGSGERQQTAWKMYRSLYTAITGSLGDNGINKVIYRDVADTYALSSGSVIEFVADDN